MILSILVSIIFFAGSAIFLVRFLGEAGVSLPDNRVFSFITADKAASPLEEKTTAKECVYIFIAALLFRIFIFVIGWLAVGIFRDDQALSFMDYCGRWNLWDGPHYIEIARDGYAKHIEDGQHLFLVFFPLYPLMARILALIVRNYVISSILTSMLCFGGGCVLMYKLVSMDYGKSIAKTSVILLSVSPFSFFFGGVMTESTFFLLIIATFLAIRQHKWFLASLTRSFGVFMVFPAAIEWAQTEKPLMLMRKKQWKELGKRFVRLLPVALTPIGTLIYLYINYRVEGDPFVFMKYQSEHWNMNLQYFGKTVKMLAERGFNSSDDITLRASLFLPGLVSIILASIACLFGARRLRSMYTVFMLAYFLFNAAASWPLSVSRYMSCMFPAFWLVASLTDRNKHVTDIVIASSAVLMGIYLTGYLTIHQIM